MIIKLRQDAEKIINGSIRAVLPDEGVKRALEGKSFPGRVFCVSIGKAGWQMAETAEKILGGQIEKGIVITKYGHVKGEIPGFRCLEAGHPVPDENGFRATEEALNMVRGITERDTVLFLISGGGSALFEKPLIHPDELKDINRQLLLSGADITEMNTIRKRLSGVKGGRFAEACYPGRVFCVILSDIIGDPVDMIASGPAVPDLSTSSDALRIADEYGIKLSDEALDLLKKETPKTLDNVSYEVTGSVKELVNAAEKICSELGYETVFLTDRLQSEAREAGAELAELTSLKSADGKKIALIEGGETVVHVTGTGIGGRNQELALSAAKRISGLDAAIFSVGSDGTDGPTDAAGGYVDGDTYEELEVKGIDIDEVLENNDSYNALRVVGGLIFTGPTGTNVNDLTVALINK